MKKIINEKLNEAVSSIIPVMIIMLIISMILKFSIVTIISILISTLLLIIGVTLFTFGADLSMMEMGKTISQGLLKTKKVSLILIISLIVGVVITVAEPDLKVLASQMTAINSTTLIVSVGVGVGLFLSISAARIIYQISLKKIIAICYFILILMIFISKKEIIPLSFDSGGVTTGPMSVPFILAMGIGFASSRSRSNSSNDSFGLIALCSIGPILTVLILGLFMKDNLTYTYNINPEITDYGLLISNYIHEIVPIFKEVLISLFPIIGVFVLFSLVTRSVSKRQLIKVSTGIPITLIGLTLFFIGVNVGYLPVAYLLGINLYSNFKNILILVGMIIGFVIVKAEPAVAVLTEQIEKLTEGSIKRKVMNNTIALGVSIAVGLSIYRVINGVSINLFLIIGYLIAIILMKFTPNIFTMVAFDSGGAVTGPMTTSFLLPLIIGICYACGGNVLTDAFGLVAFVALSPLITIQTLGIIYNQKSKSRLKLEQVDETIIEYKRGNING